MSIGYMIIAHLIGDFLLQNDWMQRKSKSSMVCTVHVLTYTIPFALLGIWGTLPWVAVAAISIQHWIQDRFALHIKWMGFYSQTTPERWPVGPLCIDQSFHLAWIAIVILTINGGM